jgi:glutaryl-CoA dehydrogenase
VAQSLAELVDGLAADHGEVGPLSSAVPSVGARPRDTRKARLIAVDARDLLGGSGILLDHHVIRHMADLEAIHIFEGSKMIQTLIVGRDITGVSAFA